MVDIVTRAEWGARAPKQRHTMVLPSPRVWVNPRMLVGSGSSPQGESRLDRGRSGGSSLQRHADVRSRRRRDRLDNEDCSILGCSTCRLHVARSSAPTSDRSRDVAPGSLAGCPWNHNSDGERGSRLGSARSPAPTPSGVHRRSHVGSAPHASGCTRWHRGNVDRSAEAAAVDAEDRASLLRPRFGVGWQLLAKLRIRGSSTNLAWFESYHKVIEPWW